MSTVLPVTVIGGYLGAGKTTLVNAMLRDTGGRRLAILVNEFGALPIDEDLIEAQGDEMISIAGGCVCCTFGSDLTGALQDLSALNPRPDHIIVEASGVAMPGAIAANVGLLDGFSLSGIIVLCDCETIRAQAVDDYLGDTVLRQLRDADMLLLTKADLVTQDQLTATEGWLTAQNSTADLVTCVAGQVPTDVVLDRKRLNQIASGQPHADDGFESLIITAQGGDPTALARHLATGGLGVIRAKGFSLDESGQTHVVQIVGERHTVKPFDRPMPAEIVVIGRRGQLDREKLSRLGGTGT